MSASGHTGHGVDFTLSTSGFSLTIIDVQEPSFEGTSVPLPSLGLDDGAVIPQAPGDTLEPGQIVVTVEHDPAYEEPTYVVQDAVVTHPAPPGMTNGQVNTYTGAFVINYERPTNQSGERRQGTLTVQVNDKPTITPAS
ncbi:MAG: hypothetical protein AAGF31_00455 [Planctomycetota bacterium]